MVQSFNLMNLIKEFICVQCKLSVHSLCIFRFIKAFAYLCKYLIDYCRADIK